jgi:transposase
MFLRFKERFKDGKKHRYWSIVENKRVTGGRIVQRQVLYLGEINDGQQASWLKTIEVIEYGKTLPKRMCLFPATQPLPLIECKAIGVKLTEIQLKHPREWGACWLFNELWNQLQLDNFWKDKLLPGRKKTRWLNILKTLTAYRLIDPGSEWRLHRDWYEQNALNDLLGEDFALVQKDKLYRCMDKLLLHKEELFSFLRERWVNLFDVNFDVLLYDLTSTYFECDPPKEGKRKFGYSRDKRSDCVQVIIALIITPEGFPLAYEVMPGNTKDSNTLKEFLEKIEKQYGKANRTWIMDRGIPTEETIAQMQQTDSPINYLVGTPKGKLSNLEAEFLGLNWEEIREKLKVKLLSREKEVYILVKSEERINKERSMRKRKLKKLWKRLKELQTGKLSRDQLLLKIGAAKKDAGKAYYLVKINLPESDKYNSEKPFTFLLQKEKLKNLRKREGRYLLRSNLIDTDPAKLWKQYILLTEIEQVFKELKGDLSLRPIHHQKDDRIEAHIFISFLAYCLNVTLKHKLRAMAPGLTARAVLEKFRKIKMVDIYLPTTDGRNLLMSRYTEPENEHKILLQKLGLHLPVQSMPKIINKEIMEEKIKMAL